MNGIGPLISTLLGIVLVWMRHRLDPAEVQYRRLKEIRVETLEETRDFRRALAGKDGLKVSVELRKLIERARGNI